MRFTERYANHYTLEDISTVDFKYKNAEGIPYNEGGTPRHYISLWLDPEVAEEMKALGFNVQVKEDSYNKLGVRPYCNFSMKPGVRYNRRTDKEEFSPKVVMKTPTKTRRLRSAKSFSNIDKSLIEHADMSFRSYEYEPGKWSLIIEGFWFSTADSVGTGEPDFDEAYGYNEPDIEPDDDEEDAPF